jgi:2-dehydro-3-deoxygalactonokinase
MAVGTTYAGRTPMAGSPNGEMTPAGHAFVSCDWGSTSFRLRIVELGTRRILAEQQAPNGIKTFAALSAAERSTAMAALLAERLGLWPDLDRESAIVVSGMASSNVGWEELPYTRTPFPLDGSRCGVKWISLPDREGQRRKVLLVAGVRTDDDIMRGEECVLIGARALQPGLLEPERSVLALLAGTHPKHAVLTAGVLVSFRTHLTGELFDVLAGASLLSASVDRAAAGGPPDLAQFRAGVAATRRLGFSGALFQVRARSILEAIPKPANTWFLSGLLVGAELERIVSSGELPPLLLIGDPLRLTLYREALRECAGNQKGPEAVALDLGTAVIAGQEILLHRAWASRAP